MGGVAECLSYRYHIEAKCFRKPDRQTVDSDLKWWCGRRASIAGKTLRPTESPMGPLRSRLYGCWLNQLCWHVLKRTKGEQNRLCAQQMEPALSEMTALPIAPKH